MLQSQQNLTNLTPNQTVSNSSIVAYVAFEVIIALLALLSNSLVLHAVWKFKRLHTTPYKLVASLAVADIAVAAIGIPSGIVLRFSFVIPPEQEGTGPRLNHALCSTFASVVLILTQVSIFHLLIIAIDRFLSIRYSLRYKAMVTPLRVRLAIVAAWVSGMVFGIGPQIGWESAHHVTSDSSHNSTPLCSFEHIISMKYMVYVDFFGCVLLPLIVMFVLYYFIFKSAREQLKKIYSDVLFYKKQNSKGSLSSLKSLKDVFIVRKRQEEKMKKSKLSLRTEMFFKRNGKKSSIDHQRDANRGDIYDIHTKTESPCGGTIKMNCACDATIKVDSLCDVTGRESTSEVEQEKETSISNSRNTSALPWKGCSIVTAIPSMSFDCGKSPSESSVNLEIQCDEREFSSELDSCDFSRSSALSPHESPPIIEQLHQTLHKSEKDQQRKLSSISNVSSVCTSASTDNNKMRMILRRKSKYLKKEFKAAKSLFIVLGAFVLCWIPLHICNCVTLFGPSVAETLPWLLDCTILLSHANSLINPIIYAFQLSDMKIAFKKLLKQYWTTLSFCLCCVCKDAKHSA